MGCSRNKSKEDVLLRYMGDNIVVNYNGVKEYMRIPFPNIEPQIALQPVFCVDITNNSIFIYVPHFGVTKYDLLSKKLVQEDTLLYKYQKMNDSYGLRILNDHVILSSHLHILVYNKNLKIEASLRDTIEENLCPNYALHSFDSEFLGDTLLFKAMFIEINDFGLNKRFKRIYKDFEFILGQGKVMCNNCDTCNRKSVLTKPELDDLLKNPY